MSVVTCPICEHQVELIPDGKLRFCHCHCLGVDHTKEYTRYLGVIPKEDSKFPDYWERILKCRELYN